MRDHVGMRILVSSSPGVGHLLPLLPVARVAQLRGHDVVVAGGTGLADIATAAGFRFEAMGPASTTEVARQVPELARLTGRARAVVAFRAIFCEAVAPAMADGITAFARDWRPDMIVHEDLELGSWIVAERLGIPHATVQATAWRPQRNRIAQEPLNALRERHGLAPDDGLTGLEGRIFFTTRPRSLRDPEVPLPDVTAELRPIADDRHDGDVTIDDPFPPRDGRPRVAVTLGTVNQNEAELLRALIDGAVAAEAHVVVALGADPASLGAVPPGVAVHAYVPMSTLLPAADVVAFHGGSGTMLAALAAGIPLVIVPVAADQPDNADLCSAAGVARVVPLDGVDAAGVRAAIETVTTEEAYRSRALEVAEEIAAMPGPDAAVERLEAIVEGQR